MPKAKKRNYSANEIEVLLDTVERYKRIIFSSVSSGFSNANKNDCWKKITAAINSVSAVERYENYEYTPLY